MSCSYQTLVTNVRSHPSGNQRKPTRGGPGSFHCGGRARSRTAPLCVPPLCPSLWGVPESLLPLPVSFMGIPFISTRDFMFTFSFPQVCACPQERPISPFLHQCHRTLIWGPQPHFHVPVPSCSPCCAVARDAHLFSPQPQLRLSPCRECPSVCEHLSLRLSVAVTA